MLNNRKKKINIIFWNRIKTFRFIHSWELLCLFYKKFIRSFVVYCSFKRLFYLFHQYLQLIPDISAVAFNFWRLNDIKWYVEFMILYLKPCKNENLSKKSRLKYNDYILKYNDFFYDELTCWTINLTWTNKLCPFRHFWEWISENRVFYAFLKKKNKKTKETTKTLFSWISKKSEIDNNFFLYVSIY